MSDAPKMEVPIVHKPSWLDRDTFEALLDRYDIPHCETCGTSDDLTVDHIVARHLHGTDALENLQLLCRFHNSQKGIRPDSHWGQSFYWDELPDEEGFARLRYPQQDLFNQIVHYRADWFGGRAIKEIARHLYANLWVVGAGKTLGIAVAGWAVNQTIRNYRGPSARRCDRMLIIVKDQAIRDQIADSLRTDLTKLGIARRNPRVSTITEGWQLRERAWLDSHDVLVMCEQNLWETAGEARKDLVEILAHFPVIAFDEPHYATTQIARIVEAANESLCFGFTGTPIDRYGALLPRTVALTIYDYDEACDNDRSLKYLSADHDSFHGLFVNELGIHDADIIKDGSFTITEDPGMNGYAANVEPVAAVVKEVIAEMVARDEIRPGQGHPAPHRHQGDVEASLLYPVHAIVYFDSVDTAENLARHFNQWFDAHRDEYPEHLGWKVEVAHAGGKSGKSKPLARKEGAQPHPWMRFKRTGRLDKGCARILFVVDMAREGVNNPYCGIVGVACKSGSALEPVQGWLGRQLRAVTERQGMAFRVPPAPLDTARIVTHAAFGVAPAIREGIGFICDMRGRLAEVLTIEQLERGEPVAPEEIQRGVDLPSLEKVKIVCAIGARFAAGEPIDVEGLVRQFAPAGGRRADRVRELAETVQRDPGQALKEARLATEIEAVPIVMRERIRRDPSDWELEQFVKTHKPRLVRKLPVTSDNREYLAEFFDDHKRGVHAPPLALSERDKEGRLIRINKLVRSQIGSAVLSALAGHIDPKNPLVWKLSTAAGARKLGVPLGRKLEDGGDWDTPQAHAIIRRADVRNELVGWVVRKLAENGQVPNLALLFRREGAPGGE